MEIGRKPIALLLVALLLSSCTASVSAAFPSKIVSNFVSNAASSLIKRLWSFKSTTKTAVAGRSMVRFESGYTVETVFDGSKLGIEPHSVEVTQSGDLLVLDSVNSNIYKLSLPLSRYTRPKLVAGSVEGYSGHVDGRSREAKLNHPKGLTMDDRGNIYVADAMNMAIRKISDAGVTTIAGGKTVRGGHVDGPSDEAKFSTDFEVRYLGSSCSLLVIDRGNQAIREIQLNFDDCAYNLETGFPLGLVLLFAAGFFGYMLALLQRRVGVMVFSQDEPQAPMMKANNSIPPYQKPMKSSLRPPLIPPEIEAGKQDEDEEGFFTSIGKLLGGARSSLGEILFALFRKKQQPSANITTNPYQYQSPQHQLHKTSTWPAQETFSIPHDESPPPIDARTPTPKKSYAFMAKEPDKIHHLRHARSFGEPHQEQQNFQPQTHTYYQQHLQQHRQYSTGPQTIYEQSCESTNEIVFGAVQEMDNKRRVEIKALNYGDSYYEQYGMRYRQNYLGYSNNF
ncbi:NHL domain-containing protein [Rhynchospora pubera]|uniref:NHL domain-containing protein n=1 Tax=Rhynchospora pubera TaxID=906938 RepID=A0AAV8D918_9POAL|nr:NHL domain-containing protein [Rhynchospora pubera]